MIQLRNYQNESIRLLRDLFRTKKRLVLCLPTGAGKTVVFSEMVRLAYLKGTTTLVLTDRKELFKQTITALGRVGVPVEEIAPHNRKRLNRNALIFLAMVETIKRRLPEINPSLIIIDEAHKGNFTKLIEQFPNAHIIGATATLVGKHFEKHYHDIVQVIDTPDLVRSGFLAPCKPYMMKDDFSDLEVKAGEFTEQSLNNHFNKPKLYEGVIENYLQYAKGMKTIVFNCNISHTQNINEAFVNAGISSKYITSETPKDQRDKILAEFKSGEIDVLNNCGILTTGYDEPTIECVIVNRATKSLPLWLQCAGRGSRTNPNKERFVLLDFGGNHTRHGLWNEPRTWSLKQKKKREGVAPVKTCPQCSAMLSNMVRVCEYCAFEFPEPIKLGPSKGVMIEITPIHLKGRKVANLSVEELIELQQSGKYKPTFIWRVVRSKNELEKYASLMGYSSGWVWRQKTQGAGHFTNYTI